MTKIIAIAGMNENRVIGKDNKIPWRVPEDMKRFAELTTGHSVLMGRKTYFSLPDKFRPLPNRHNIVVTRNPDVLAIEDVQVETDLNVYLEDVKSGKAELNSEILWVIGGSEIYALAMPYCDQVYLTLIKGKHDGDSYFPEFEQDFKLDSEEHKEDCTFQIYKKS